MVKQCRNSQEGYCCHYYLSKALLQSGSRIFLGCKVYIYFGNIIGSWFKKWDMILWLEFVGLPQIYCCPSKNSGSNVTEDEDQEILKSSGITIIVAMQAY